MRTNLLNKILSVTPNTFNDVAINVFHYQYTYNTFYRQYVDLLGKNPSSITNITEIPFLPISFFKTQSIKTGYFESEAVFTSSGTSGQNTSKHFVRNLDWYDSIAQQIFENQYGKLSNFRILALLPSYLERQGSSLVRMAQQFIQKSNHSQSGFYLNEWDNLWKVLKTPTSQKTLLLGVSFALLDLADKYQGKLNNTIIMETGGMKGRRKELIRSDLHQILAEAFSLPHIHSEYGMTELLSQAYSQQNGKFYATKTMKILVREINDPFSFIQNRVGGINIIDLANIDSISFIATDDLGIVNHNEFQVLGRFDNSDIRGCNLLYF